MKTSEEWIALILDWVGEKYSDLNIVPADPKRLVFETRTKMNCFYCGRYMNNWKCPPNLPDIDYRTMFCEYDYGAFVYIKMSFKKENFQDIRTESSNRLHRALLDIEKVLWENDCPLAISFGAGACKLCRDGCGKERCRNPYMARSPLEATGVNVIKSAALYGIEIAFPPKDFLMRIGYLLW